MPTNAVLETGKSLNYEVHVTKKKMCDFLGANFYSQWLQITTINCISSDDFSHKPIQTRISKVKNEK
jgi:hypothetical protein